MFDNREKLETLVIFGLEDHNFDLSEKSTKKVSLSFLTSFQKLFPSLSMTTIDKK